MRVVAAAITRNGRVLVSRRAPGRRQAGCWELAGGQVEPSESDADALARELREELAVEVEVGARLGESRFAYAHGEIVLVGYACAWRSGEPTLRDHDAHHWLAPGELAAAWWAPADLPLIPPLIGLLRERRG